MSANRELSFKFFCIKIKKYQLIRVLCFLEIVTRYRKEIDATKLQKNVQIVFIKGEKVKKAGRQRAVQNWEAFLK